MSISKSASKILGIPHATLDVMHIHDFLGWCFLGGIELTLDGKAWDLVVDCRRRWESSR